MPVYHFTFHAYGSWLPDHPKGYIRRKKGWQPPDPVMARHYRADMRQDPARFTTAIQQAALDSLLASERRQRFTLYAYAGDNTHLHVIAGWTDSRKASAVCRQLKTSITRSLNQNFGKRNWLARNAGHTPVEDHEHLYQLVCTYLPKHRGVYWQPRRGDTDS